MAELPRKQPNFPEKRKHFIAVSAQHLLPVQDLTNPSYLYENGVTSMSASNNASLTASVYPRD